MTDVNGDVTTVLPRVLYNGGLGHSGSTLLDLMLGRSCVSGRNPRCES